MVSVGLELEVHVVDLPQLLPCPCPSLLLPQLRHGYLLVVVLVEDLGSRQVKVLLCNMHPPLAQGIHARLRADTLQLSARAPIHLLGDLCQVDPACQVHRPRVDP